VSLEHRDCAVPVSYNRPERLTPQETGDRIPQRPAAVQSEIKYKEHNRIKFKDKQ